MVLVIQKTVLEVERETRKYYLECSPDSPLGELYDVLDEMKRSIVQLMHEQDQKLKTEPEHVVSNEPQQ